MMFLSTNLITDDLKRFAEGIKTMYKVDHVEIYVENTNEEKMHLGYSFVHEEKPVVLKMPYFKNDLGELAIDEHNKVWTVKWAEEETTGYKTMGDAFEYIGLERR